LRKQTFNHLASTLKKLFFIVTVTAEKLAGVFVPGKTFQPSLTFDSKVGGERYTVCCVEKELGNFLEIEFNPAYS